MRLDDEAMPTVRAALPYGPPRAVAEERVVHVWLAELDRASDEQRSWLSGAERDRAAAIVVPARRRRWELARGVLRELLARYIGCHPRDVALLQQVGRPPRLSPQSISHRSAPRLRFALSHSLGGLLVALAAGEQVAVDLERATPGGAEVRVASRAFGPAAATSLAVLEPAERQREFRRLWARHEALIKLGESSIWTGRQPAQDAGQECWVHDLGVPGAGEAGALACRSRPVELVVWAWAPAADAGQKID